MPRRRRRAALATGVVAGVLLPLLIGPVVAQAVSSPVTCPDVGRDGPWQILPVEAFRGTEGVSTRDVVTGYAVDPSRPQRVLATNGNRVKVSGSFGCAWEDGLVLDATPDAAVPVSGAISAVVTTALLPGGPAMPRSARAAEPPAARTSRSAAAASAGRGASRTPGCPVRARRGCSRPPVTDAPPTSS